MLPDGFGDPLGQFPDPNNQDPFGDEMLFLQGNVIALKK